MYGWNAGQRLDTAAGFFNLVATPSPYPTSLGETTLGLYQLNAPRAVAQPDPTRTGRLRRVDSTISHTRVPVPVYPPRRARRSPACAVEAEPLSATSARYSRIGDSDTESLLNSSVSQIHPSTSLSGERRETSMS
eukprot:scaffold53109_cov57-Phaeocystis_antarctica.AAC.3